VDLEQVIRRDGGVVGITGVWSGKKHIKLVPHRGRAMVVQGDDKIECRGAAGFRHCAFPELRGDPGSIVHTVVQHENRFVWGERIGLEGGAYPGNHGVSERDGNRQCKKDNRKLHFCQPPLMLKKSHE
jgi:hypothetical protein